MDRITEIPGTPVIRVEEEISRWRVRGSDYNREICPNQEKSAKSSTNYPKSSAKYPKLYSGAPILLNALLVDVSMIVLRNTSELLR